MVKEAREIFDQIDVSRDGNASMKEFKEFFQKRFRFVPNKETLLSIVASIDPNGQQQIVFKDFLKAIYSPVQKSTQ
jgi:Ca2+-binding EF-hand superfamily protein